MFRIQHVDRIDHPDLAIYVSLKITEEHRKLGVFVVEGHRVLERLIESDFEIVSCLFPEKWVSHFCPLLEARPELISVFVAPIEAMTEWTGVTFYQGVLAVAKIPNRKTILELLPALPEPRLVAAAEGIHNAQNMGVLIRNCAAMGAQALLVGETSCSPFVRLAVRASMGTIFKIRIIETTNLIADFRNLRETGFRCIAAHPNGGRSLWDLDFSGDVCCVFGNEGEGLTPAALECCDDAAAIPMAAGVDSLNVSNAAAVFLYEAVRQRRIGRL